MRSTWINLHLYAASFFLPMILLVAISGGLYLIGEKGSVERAPIELPTGTRLDFSSSTLTQEVRTLLTQLGKDADFDYLKIAGGRIMTRPTSEAYFVFSHTGEILTLNAVQPDLQSRLIELHKGHGPTWFKTYQKAFALGLLFIVISGAWLGLSSPNLRRPTAITVAAGTLVTLGLMAA